VQGGINVTSEALTLNGLGFGGAGALENVSGHNTWANPITLGSNVAIGVDVPTDTLSIATSIGDLGGNFGVTKVGPGILDYSGGVGTDNTYTGQTQVNEGTLLLDKSGGASSLNGNLTIGDNLGGAALVRWMFDNQVPDSADVVVQSDGTL